MQAGCRGMDTELFYMPHDMLLEQEGFGYRTLRRVCFHCPIWRECLAYGMENEPYGFRGGFSEEERKNIYTGVRPKSFKQLLTDLTDNGVEWTEIVSIIKSVTPKFGAFKKAK